MGNWRRLKEITEFAMISSNVLTSLTYGRLSYGCQSMVMYVCEMRSHFLCDFSEYFCIFDDICRNLTKHRSFSLNHLHIRIYFEVHFAEHWTSLNESSAGYLHFRLRSHYVECDHSRWESLILRLRSKPANFSQWVQIHLIFGIAIDRT